MPGCPRRIPLACNKGWIAWGSEQVRSRLKCMAEQVHRKTCVAASCLLGGPSCCTSLTCNRDSATKSYHY